MKICNNYCLHDQGPNMGNFVVNKNNVHLISPLKNKMCIDFKKSNK